MSPTAALMVRELRIEARRPWNYWSRTAAGAVVVLSFFLVAGARLWDSVKGIELFLAASWLTQTLIWVFASMLTADCLSKEKREGTLGLLFLTPLTSAGIVVAKSIVHALRASSVIVAGLPVVALSVLFGGVSMPAIVAVFLHHLGALSLALAAGLLASAWTRDWLRAVILAVCFALLFRMSFYHGAFVSALPPSVSSAVTAFVFSLLTLAGCGALAAYRIRGTWQDVPPPRWVVWLRRTFCSPLVWKDLFYRISNLKLERNPIGWLYERTATARTSKWLWCAGAVIASSLAIGSSNQLPVLTGFELALALAMAFAGASSFRRERQNGVMELLLVAPLKMDGIIGGRLRSLLRQFSPAVAMVIVLGTGFLLWEGQNLAGNEMDILLPHFFLLATSLAILPPLGMYFSFRLQRFLSAWLAACLVGIAIPYYVASLVCAWPDQTLFGWMSTFQVCLSLLVIKRLRTRIGRSSLAFPI